MVRSSTTIAIVRRVEPGVVAAAFCGLVVTPWPGFTTSRRISTYCRPIDRCSTGRRSADRRSADRPRHELRTGQILLLAVLKDFEIVHPESRNDLAILVGDRDIDLDQSVEIRTIWSSAAA